MKYLMKEDYKDFMPQNINIELAEVKGLANNGMLNNEYFVIQSIYYAFLEKVLEEKLGLFSIESLFLQANLKPVLEDEKDIYQYLSNHQYFYIRNTLYVENLTKEEIQVLLVSKEINDEIRNIVFNNLKNVLVSSKISNPNIETNSGPLSSSFLAPVDSLVLGIRFLEEEESAFKTEDAWFEYYCNKREKIERSKENDETQNEEEKDEKIFLTIYL